MPRILCRLPNASARINGVEFKSTPAGMLSEDLADDVAAAFARIPGYEVVQPQGRKKAAADKPAEAATSAEAPAEADAVPAEAAPAEAAPAE